MRLIFLGPPGAGKGTQAGRVAEHYKLSHIATGDMLRRNLELSTELGLKAKPFMERGQLVPDELTIPMFLERINEQDAQKGFILDGFPRNVEQAELLDQVLDEMGAQLDKVLKFMVLGSELVARLAGRRFCPICKSVYHVKKQPPKNEGVCDKDGAKLEQRPDDGEHAILERLEVYGEKTRPLFDYYAGRGLLADVDAIGLTDVVFQRLLTAIDR